MVVFVGQVFNLPGFRGKLKTCPTKHKLRTTDHGLIVESLSRLIRENVLGDVIVGGGGIDFAEAVALELAQGLGGGPAVVFHAIDGAEHAGAMQAGAAMNEH